MLLKFCVMAESLQNDKSNDISQKCQLLSCIRFVENNVAVEPFLSCAELLTLSTGQDINL